MSALLEARKKEVIAKVRACIEKGNELYGITLPHVDIRFDLKGRCAGMAGKRGNHYFVRFNTDMMMRDAWDHIINDTTPHEIAHSFCQFQPRLGNGHDYGWASVCRALGGNGRRAHSEAVVYGKGATYEYTTTVGKTVRVSQTIHGKIQRGVEYTYRGGKGKVNQTCAFSIVGIHGKTLAAPIVKKPTVQTPAVVMPTPAVVPQRVPTFIIGAPEVKPAAPISTNFAVGTSKASIARAIMLAGHTRGETYENIITAIMQATGHDRQLARATFKANAAKVGIPL